MCVDLGDIFCLVRVTVISSRRSPLADHLRLTVNSSIASTRRTLTYQRILTLATIHHVYSPAFSFTPADVEDSISLGISLRSRMHGGCRRTYTYRHVS